MSARASLLTSASPGQRHEPGRRELADDLREALGDLRVPVAGGVQGGPLRQHDAGVVERGVRLGGADQRLADLDVDDQLGDVLLDVLEPVDADRVGQFGGQAQEELALGDGAGDHLVGHERAGAGLGVEARCTAAGGRA